MSQGLLQGDMLSTSRYYEGRRQRMLEEPILRLMLAVFAAAWADASYGGSLRMCVQQRNEAVDWFVNPYPHEGLFTFENVCEALGYDVDATRMKICEKLERAHRQKFTRRTASRPNPRLVARRAGRSRAEVVERSM
jgi:hypothetical protein